MGREGARYVCTEADAVVNGEADANEAMYETVSHILYVDLTLIHNLHL